MKFIISTILSSFVFHLSSKPIHAQQWGSSQYAGLNQAIGLGGQINTTDLGTIISSLLPYIFTIAGLILFSMLVAGGFTMLAGAANEESQKKGKQMVTSALGGFAVIFLAYWIAQILQVIFKIDIVG